MKLYIELAINAPEDAHGYTEAVIHATDACEAIQRDDSPSNFRGVWPVELGKPGNPFTIKLGRGAWVKIKDDPNNRCPDCLPPSPFTFEEIVDKLDKEHYGHEKGNESWLGLSLKKVARCLKITEGEVLQAMREVARRYKRRLGEKPCRSCGMPITFRNNTLYDRSRKNHFIACPNREAHRAKKKGKS